MEEGSEKKKKEKERQKKKWKGKEGDKYIGGERYSAKNRGPVVANLPL